MANVTIGRSHGTDKPTGVVGAVGANMANQSALRNWPLQLFRTDTARRNTCGLSAGAGALKR